MGRSSVRWFGQSWGAPICDPDDHAPTPVDAPCARCWEPLDADARGVLIPHLEPDGFRERPWHINCFLESIGVSKNDRADDVVRAG